MTIFLRNNKNYKNDMMYWSRNSLLLIEKISWGPKNTWRLWQKPSSTLLKPLEIAPLFLTGFAAYMTIFASQYFYAVILNKP